MHMKFPVTTFTYCRVLWFGIIWGLLKSLGTHAHIGQEPVRYETHLIQVVNKHIMSGLSFTVG